MPSRYIVDQFTTKDYAKIDEFYKDLEQRDKNLNDFLKEQKSYKESRDYLRSISQASEIEEYLRPSLRKTCPNMPDPDIEKYLRSDSPDLECK